MRISMMKPVFCAAMTALVLFSFCLVTEVHAGMFKEGWYMSRGKANMKIKNYKAAIEAFEKLVESNPHNREAMRKPGRAYELQGLTDKAIEQYHILIDRNPKNSAAHRELAAA